MFKIMKLSLLFITLSVMAGCHSSDKTVNTSIPIKTTTVKRILQPLNINSFGTVLSKKSTYLSPISSGIIIKKDFHDGEYVKKGQLLYVVDNTIAKANLASQQAKLELTLSTLNKDKELLARRFFSKQDWDVIATQAQTQKAKLASLLKELHQRNIIAPYDGLLTASAVDVGSYVKPGEKLVEIINLSNLVVEYNLSANALPYISLGQNVVVTIPSLANKHFTAKVSYISPTLDSMTRTIAIQAHINTLNMVLKPGFFALIKQTVLPDHYALLVPQRAVLSNLNEKYVYIVAGNKVKLTKVSCHANQRGQLVVSKGLSDGDVIVVAGQQNLTDGATIKVIN